MLVGGSWRIWRDPLIGVLLPVSPRLLDSSAVCLTGHMSWVAEIMEPASLVPFPRPVAQLPSSVSFFDAQPNPRNSHYDRQQLEIYNKRPAQRIRNPPSPLPARGSLKRSQVVKNLRGGAKNLRELSRMKSRVRGGKGKRREEESSQFSLSSLLPSLASFVFGKGGVGEEDEERKGNARRRSEDLRGSQSGTYDEKPQVSIPTEK